MASELKVLKLLSKLESKSKKHFGLNKIKYKVKFDLNSSTTLGLFKFKTISSKRSIHLNPTLLESAKWSNFKEIVIHEFAHLINNLLNGPYVQSHGSQWKMIMKVLGASEISARTNAFSSLKKKSSDKLAACKCKELYISANRATRINNGAKYYCRICSKKLKLIEEVI